MTGSRHGVVSSTFPFCPPSTRFYRPFSRRQLDTLSAADVRSLLSPLSSLGLSSAIRPAVVYWLGFVVQQDNRVVWLEWADEWCSRSRTKSPPLCFIDVLMRLNWLPSEFVLYTVVGRQMPVDTWC